MTGLDTLRAARANRSAGAPLRDAVLDRVRGLAILLMIGDHVALFLYPLGQWYRFTGGRLAMPLFFVLAGYLARRLRWRHLRVGILGLVLAVLVPWLDLPNVLSWWALGCVVLWVAADRPRVLMLLAVVGLSLSANGWGWHAWRFGDTYEPFALLGLMALGRLAALSDWRPFAWGRRLPRFLELPGRHPVLIYAGHTLALQALVIAGVR